MTGPDLDKFQCTSWCPDCSFRCIGLRGHNIKTQKHTCENLHRWPKEQ